MIIANDGSYEAFLLQNKTTVEPRYNDHLGTRGCAVSEKFSILKVVHSYGNRREEEEEVFACLAIGHRKEGARRARAPPIR